MPYQQPSALTPIDALNNYLANLYPLILDAMLRIVGALVIFLVGWFVALVIKLVIEFILNKIKLEEVFKSAKLDQYFKDFSWEERLDKVIAELLFWVVLLVFLMTAFDVLGFQIVNSFIYRIVNYIPTAVAGGLILLAGFIVGELARKVTVGIFHGLEKRGAHTASSLVKWSIVVFAFLAALNQWGIAADIINILVMGFVLFLALAGGLAFGLGGQETAREILEDLRKQLR